MPSILTFNLWRTPGVKVWGGSLGHIISALRFGFNVLHYLKHVLERRDVELRYDSIQPCRPAIFTPFGLPIGLLFFL